MRMVRSVSKGGATVLKRHFENFGAFLYLRVKESEIATGCAPLQGGVFQVQRGRLGCILSSVFLRGKR